MSWEGYYRHICANGHTYVGDPYRWEEDPYENCPHCNAPAVWTRVVDQTNDAGEDPPLEVKTPAVVKTCDLGHAHIVEQATYHIPEKR